MACLGCEGSSSSHTCQLKKKRKKEEHDDPKESKKKRLKPAPPTGTFCLSFFLSFHTCLPPDEEIKAALEWLTCDDLREIKQSKGATQQSVKTITNELLDDPELNLTTVRISAVRCRKTPLSAEQVRDQWRNEDRQKVLIDSKNHDTRRTFLKVVRRVKTAQTDRQEAAASVTEKKREEKKRIAAIERAENQARRNRLHTILSKHQTYPLAICPVTSWIHNFPICCDLRDKRTVIVEAKLKDRSAIGTRFRPMDDFRRFEFSFESVKLAKFNRDGTSYVLRSVSFFYSCLSFCVLRQAGLSA